MKRGRVRTWRKSTSHPAPVFSSALISGNLNTSSMWASLIRGHMIQLEEFLFDRMTVRRWCVAVVVGATCSGIGGYFTGRAVLKAEIRSQLSEAATAISDGLSRSTAEWKERNRKWSEDINRRTEEIDARLNEQSAQMKERRVRDQETDGYRELVDGFRSLKNDPKYRDVHFIAGHTGDLPAGIVDVMTGHSGLTSRQREMMLNAFHEVFD